MTTPPTLERLTQMDALLQAVKSDNETMSEVRNSLKTAIDRATDLEQYYRLHWMNDVDKAESDSKIAESGLEILGQDAIWNALEDRDNELKYALRAITAALTRTLDEPAIEDEEPADSQELAI